VLFAGERLNVCDGTSICCTPALETYLVNKTHWQFHDRVLSKMRNLHLLFANVTSTFDGMLINCLHTLLSTFIFIYSNVFLPCDAVLSVAPMLLCDVLCLSVCYVCVLCRNK